jgi:hypothetical protein
MNIKENTIFNKIEVFIKNGTISVNKLEYFDSSIIISGNFIIISKQKINLKTKEDEVFSIEITNKTYELSDINGYKTYQYNNNNLKTTPLK